MTHSPVSMTGCNATLLMCPFLNYCNIPQYQLFNKLVSRHSSKPGICTRTAKTRAIPSLYRDSFLAKVYGHCPVLRHVAQPPHIAGPLWLIRRILPYRQSFKRQLQNMTKAIIKIRFSVSFKNISGTNFVVIKQITYS